MPRTLSSCVLLLFLVPVAHAATRDLTITVAAGKQDRTNVPVRAHFTLPLPAEPWLSVVVKDAAGQSLPAQLTEPGLLAPLLSDGTSSTLVIERELHFIVPKLNAGQAATFKATLSSAPSSPNSGFAWKEASGDQTDLVFAGKPVLRYVHPQLDDSSKEKRELTYKPFHHVFDPEGDRLVTKGAGGQFTHHRGLFFGFNKVTYGAGKQADVWHCTGDAHQSHEKVLASEAGPVLGRQRVEIAWHGPGKQVFAVEQREVTVYNTPGGRLIEFASLVRGKELDVKLDGDPQHAGFHFRADDEVAKKTNKQTIYIRPDGVGKPGETRNWDPKTKQGPVNLPWNAMSFVLGDQRYTAAYLDRLSNPKEARFSERDYGRFGSYFEYTITSEKPLRVNYRLWLQRGQMTPEAVAALARDFAEPLTVKTE
jgi:hypothetical protein